ncbi:MAG TPA: hypothetical protein VLD65_08710 [Anaerolineales bacterium]|nr:hypothetical protein [Anaerolineales bacterium]
MSLGLRKLLSILIVCLTALGVIISVFFLVEVWHYRMPATEKLKSGVDQFSSALQVTDEGLVVIDQVVKNVYTSTVYLNAATNAFSQTVESTSLFMDSAGIFIGDNLLATITNTQTALGSAQASAKVIDNILSTLSKVPLIGIAYNPAVPLNKALGDVSSSLDPLQTTLKDFKINLSGTRSDMQTFSSEISVLNTNIQAIQQNLSQAQVTIHQYRVQISLVKNLAKEASNSLPKWTNTAAWIITLMIAWLIVIQIAIMLQATLQISTNRFAPELMNKEE